MKRRNGDCAKIRRQVRKANRSLDDTYDSMLFISKTLAFWMITFTMDHFLHCRLEFFWYLWYLARNINSSYTQSLGLSLVFVCIAFTSDLLCYFFIPVQYLFFAASTWVWVHYIYNNERGLTPSTLILYFIIILLESSVKFKPEHRAALNINLCKPFAAHCVGFPIVTFSFSELRRNCSYFSFSLGSGGASGVKSSSQRKSSQHQSQQDLFGAFDNELSHKNSSHRKSTETQDECSAESTAGRCSSSSGTAKKSKSHHHSNHSHNSIKEESSSKQPSEPSGLEREVKQLRASLTASRSLELELRATLANLVSGERNTRSELSESQQENQELNARLQSLLSVRAVDKQALTSLEKRLIEEKKLKATLETLLTKEKKAKRTAEEIVSKLTNSSCSSIGSSSAGACSELCKTKRRELEAETNQWRREAEERRENELQSLLRLRDEHSELERLRRQVSHVTDRNAALERSLSAETRIKLDLFSALGEAKRENEIVEGKLRKSERELLTMRTRMAQILALMPTSSFAPLTPHPTPSASPSSKHLSLDSSLLPSNLDPNALAYTPKTNGHLIMEAN
uniref:Macoilin n=1 Tax=Cacopsylla melanoneura TaxID=428564 RepID=A0A8D8TVL7_9HEMI